MFEELQISTEGTKKEKYEAIIPQIKSLTSGEHNLIANMANIAAALRETFGFFWVGFYLVDTEKELVLGPFQGSFACTRIKKGRGVCGMAWDKEDSIIVPNVDQFSDHIACSTHTKSEIVLPVFKDHEVIGVLDIDSNALDYFDQTDKKYLEQIITILD